MSNNAKKAQYLILLFAFSSVVYKIVLFAFDLQLTSLRNSDTLFNILLCLLSVFFGIFFFLKENIAGNTFVDVFKVGLRSAVLFSLLIASFNFMYYRYIDPYFLNTMILDNARELVIQGADKEKIIEYVAGAKLFLTPYNTAFLTFFIYLITGLLYSLFVTLMFAKIPYLQRLVLK